MLYMYFARRLLATGLAALLWGAVATAAQAVEPPLTFAAAVQRGLARAPQIEARAADVAATHEEAARAGRLPDPALTFGIASYPVTAPGAFSLRSDGMTMRTVGVMQAIPSRAARAAERGLADAQIGAAEANRIATAQTVQERIADAWIDVWITERARALLGELSGESALAVQTTQARLRGGEGGASDALAARAAASLLDNRLEATDADIAAAQASLQRWVGPITGPLGEAPDFSRLPVSAQSLQRSIDEQAPMQAWTAREQVAQAALDQARATRHPDWSVSAEYGKRAPRMSDMLTVQFSVSLPLFTHNRQDRGISARQAQRDAVQADHEDARRAQQETVARAAATWEGWNRQIERYQQTLLPLARDRAQTALAGYRGGGVLQPWLDARRDEIELRLSYADALAARARLWASLAYLLPSEVTP
ncbi:transporter [Rhodanobacter thiooxydans]|uniref:Transporter n=1 Tax=Rhodanobacter thiooxydans TaxID=416169 RepID=A0A154QE88_9GAMM|nr:TolC family protein [Rhodanobacter thiooxydans]EIM00602.1 Heavy metal RND efflux outer membrane protein,CzcC family [Rhodanobacter thiooxydans LCS2]KZC22542.1 transporter [Rhodanobacter thiooxydans]